VHWYVI